MADTWSPGEALAVKLRVYPSCLSFCQASCLKVLRSLHAVALARTVCKHDS